MDQLEYYSPCFYTPIIQHSKELNFENKFNINYNGLVNTCNITNGLILIYEHSPTNRIFTYNITFNEWEECD